MANDCEKCINKACLGAGLPHFTSGCSQYSLPSVDLARHIAQGQHWLNSYDYTEVEDRLRLKLDTLKDKLKDLTGDELEELEWDLDACLRIAKLFTGRRQPIEPPPVDKQPEPEQLGPCTSWGPDGQAEGFDGLCDKDKTNPMPLDGKGGGT